MATWAPKDVNIVAIALPNPLPPPVINAIFPFSASFGSIGVFLAGKYLLGSLHPQILLSIVERYLSDVLEKNDFKRLGEYNTHRKTRVTGVICISFDTAHFSQQNSNESASL